MKKEMREFSDIYSDDVGYLEEGRDALLKDKNITKALCIASFCRLFIVFMVGGMESMFKDWAEKDSTDALSEMLNRETSNEKRLQNLYEILQAEGIEANKEILDDYLALKYLRNIIIHARWKEFEKEWVEKQGFPTDTRKFTDAHWKRMREVDKNMQMYVAMLGMKSSFIKVS